MFFTDIGKMNGVTLTEIADALGIEKWAAEKRLRKAGIKPLTREAIYPDDSIEKIRDVPSPGRPPKAKPEAPTSKKPAKTTKK